MLSQAEPQKVTWCDLNKFQLPEYEKVHLPTHPPPNKDESKHGTLNITQNKSNMTPYNQK